MRMCSRQRVAYSSCIDCKKALSKCPYGYNHEVSYQFFFTIDTYTAFSTLKWNSDNELFLLLEFTATFTVALRLLSNYLVLRRVFLQPFLEEIIEALAAAQPLGERSIIFLRRRTHYCLCFYKVTYIIINNFLLIY